MENFTFEDPRESNEGENTIEGLEKAGHEKLAETLRSLTSAQEALKQDPTFIPNSHR